MTNINLTLVWLLTTNVLSIHRTASQFGWYDTRVQVAVTSNLYGSFNWGDDTHQILLTSKFVRHWTAYTRGFGLATTNIKGSTTLEELTGKGTWTSFLDERK